MRSRSLPLLVLPFLFLACSSSGGDASGDRTTQPGVAREPIIGGTHDSSHSAVVALLMEDSSNPGAFGSCSGSVVKVTNNTGYVLTAAHCCGGDPQNSGIRPSIVVAAADYGPYEQDIGNPNPAAPAYAVIPSSVKWDQSYNGTTHDFCMLQFAGAPSSMPTLKLPTSGSDGMAQGDTIEFVGYGKTSSSGQSANSARYHVTSTVDQQLSTNVMRYSEAGRGGPCEGDSGGPALTPAGASQGQQTVVAVTSFGDPSCSSYGVSSRVTSAIGTNGFITAYLAGTPLPGPTTGGASSCDSCQNKAVSVGGACYAAVQGCQNDPSCLNLADCLNTCDPNDSQCMQGCASKNSAGVKTYLAINDCVCNTGCSSECATECASSGTTPGTTGSDAGSGKGKGKDAGAGSSTGSDGTDSVEDPSTDNGATNGAENRSGTVTTTTSGCAVASGTGTRDASSATWLVGAAAFGAAFLRRRRSR